MTFPTYGHDDATDFTEQRCSYCSDSPDERPCSDACERRAVCAVSDDRDDFAEEYARGAAMDAMTDLFEVAS